MTYNVLMGTLNPTHSLTHSPHTSVRRCIKSFTSCTFVCMADSLLNYALNFVVNCTDVRNDLHYVECDVKLYYTIQYHTEVRTVRWPRIRKFIEVTWYLRLLHLQSGGSEWCTDCSGKHWMWKRSQSEETIKTDTTNVSACTTKSL